jgi:predicted GH43/DUF377 family glycosyl hydrolase
MRTLVKLTRYDKNPIMAGSGVGENWDSKGAFNAGAVMHDGNVHLLFRAEGTRPRSPGNRFWLGTIGHAVSENGFDFVKSPDAPVLDTAGEDPMIVGINGVEDPRITKIGDTYYIVYAISSACWDRLTLASTKDFKTFVKHGLIVKDMAQRTGALFPGKINGEFVLMHRPIPNIWISTSPDLKAWRGARMIMTNEVLPWTHCKLGVCGPPIRTEKAWAVIFHGKDLEGTYRLGIFWLDLNDPGKVLFVQPEPILEPEMDYETKKGITGNCVYSCGQVIKDGRVIVYYGAGDSTLCAASMPVEMLELPE